MVHLHRLDLPYDAIDLVKAFIPADVPAIGTVDFATSYLYVIRYAFRDSNRPPSRSIPEPTMSSDEGDDYCPICEPGKCTFGQEYMVEESPQNFGLD